MMHTRHASHLIAALALATVAGCTDSAGPPSQRAARIVFRTTAPGAATSASLSAAATASPLVITRAQLVFSELELEPAGVSCASGSAAERDDDSCPELRLGPTLVELPLDGSARSVLTVGVPVGTYEEIEFEIDAVSVHSDDRPQDVQAFLAAHPEFRDVSIRVQGTYNGEPFVFTTGVEVEMELEFSPPVTIAEGSTDLVIHVDLARWFAREDGSVIDPRTANAGGQNKSRVDENIEKSFDAYEERLGR